MPFLRAATVLLCVHAALEAQQPGTLYQVSTLDALSRGEYTGKLTLAELLRHGDFGVGTFDGLDGEMVALGGVVYQVRGDGSVHRPGPGETTPFAAVTFFETQQRIEVTSPVRFGELLTRLDGWLSSKDHFHAVRVRGSFREFVARSVPRQSPPYPKLAEAVEQQVLFRLGEIEGTLVGLWSPAFAAGINQAGFHFHFLRADAKAGGHAVDFEMTSGVVEIARLSRLEVEWDAASGSSRETQLR